MAKTEPDLSTFENFGEHICVPANTSLSFAYNECEKEPFYLLISGTCALQTIDKAGAELTLFYFHTYDVMSFSTALTEYLQISHAEDGDYLYSERSVFTVVTKTNCELIRFPHSSFAEMFDIGEFHLLLIRSLHRHYISLSARSVFSANNSAPAMVGITLLRNSQPASHGKRLVESFLTYPEIARRTSLHHVTVARIMRKLISEGTLSRSGKRVYIEDDDRLLRYIRDEIQLKY
jgi:CRP-like cAMP-binding protein